MRAATAVSSVKPEPFLEPGPDIRRQSPTSVLGWDITQQSDNPFPKRKLSSDLLSNSGSTGYSIGKLPSSEIERPATKSSAIANRRTKTNSNTSISGAKSTESDESRRYGKWVASKAKENAVVVVSSSSGCAMSHVVRKLLCSLGVSPMMVVLQEEDNQEQNQIESDLIKDLNSTADENRGEQNTLIKLPCCKKQRISSTINSEEIQSNESNSRIIPAVFIGGRLFGGVDKLLSAHIDGTLVPQLKQAGALWL